MPASVVDALATLGPFSVSPARTGTTYRWLEPKKIPAEQKTFRARFAKDAATLVAQFTSAIGCELDELIPVVKFGSNYVLCTASTGERLFVCITTSAVASLPQPMPQRGPPRSSMPRSPTTPSCNSGHGQC